MSEEKKRQPNILLIMADEFRGDCMGFKGHPDVKTPYLDTLASNGISFDNAQSCCPSCIAARAVMYTGLSPRHCGRVGYQDRVRWDYPHTIAGELSRAGYYTQCVGKMHVFPDRSLQGFHNIELHDGYLHQSRSPKVPRGENQLYIDDYFYWLKKELGADADVTTSGLDCNSWVCRPWQYAEKYHPTNWVTDRSIDFLRRRDPDKPFFLMASYVRPHAPYDAPQYYFDLYKDKELRPPLVGDWDDREELAKMGRVFNNSTGPSDPELIRQQQIGYYACITHLDHQIGRLMLSLIENDLADNTIILFTSDHGELLSDHALCRKSRAYQGSANIPLIISGPEALIGPRQGQRSDAMAELRDLMPTLLSMVGEDPHSVPTDGEDLLSDAIDQRLYIHGEHIAGPAGRDSGQWIVTRTDKFIWYAQTGEERYFDLAKDPGETHNAIHDAEYAQRIDTLRSILIRELSGREEGFTDGTRLITGRPQNPCLSHFDPECRD